MSYTSNPCWWTIVQVFAPRPDWSRTLGWRTCKQNAAPIRIFWYSYQKLVAREGSRACQQLRHLQLVCFISSHSFHSTFSGTYRPSALGIQGFQAQNPWHLLESFERIVFFLAWNLHTCQVTFVQLKLRMLKKSMVWWYGMQNPRKICMEHLVQGSKTSYIYIYIYGVCFPLSHHSHHSNLQCLRKSWSNPPWFPPRLLSLALARSSANVSPSWRHMGSRKFPHFTGVIWDDPRISSLAETKDVVCVPSYLCLPKPSFSQTRKKTCDIDRIYWYIIHTWFWFWKTYSQYNSKIHLFSPDVYINVFF